MANSDLDLLTSLEAPSPCGCQEAAGPLAGELELGSGEELPSAEELEASLEAALTETPFALDSPDVMAFEQALAGMELSSEEELAFAAADASQPPSIEDVLRLVERYPGLKVTFSF